MLSSYQYYSVVSSLEKIEISIFNHTSYYFEPCLFLKPVVIAFEICLMHVTLRRHERVVVWLPFVFHEERIPWLNYEIFINITKKNREKRFPYRMEDHAPADDAEMNSFRSWYCSAARNKIISLSHICFNKFIYVF